MSPYLFLLCAEAFSCLLTKAEENNLIQGVKVCPNAPSISHLLFVDDSLILFKANKESAEQIQRILQVYEASSGQTINKDKSVAFFGGNVKAKDKEDVMCTLGIEKEALNERYLGMPIHVCKSRTKTLRQIIDRILQRISGWQEKLLSRMGKELLIKAVAQAIPTFTMSCFDLTKTICEEISTFVCKYWWSQQDKSNKIHWLSWEKMIKPKGEG